MKTADGGFLLEGKSDFRTITSTYQAEEMAEVILRRSREALKLDITATLKHTNYIGEIVNVSLTSLGFSNKSI